MSSEFLFERFKSRAEAVSAQIFRVGSFAEAGNVIAGQVRELSAKTVHLASGPNVEKTNCKDVLRESGVRVVDGLDREAIATADAGISFVPYAVAETGSILQVDDSALGRMVSMLPPTHIAIVPSGNIVDTVADALNRVVADYGRMPGYVSFISGPSRTADIERVLTIGVHGPSRLIVILVDETEVR